MPERWARDGQARQGPGRDFRGGGSGHPPANPLGIIALGERLKDRIAEKLQLTNEQRDRLEHLGRDFRARQREAVKVHLAEMRAVLTPEQQKKVDEWKERRPGHPARADKPAVSAGPMQLNGQSGVEMSALNGGTRPPRDFARGLSPVERLDGFA